MGCPSLIARGAKSESQTATAGTISQNSSDQSEFRDEKGRKTNGYACKWVDSVNSRGARVDSLSANLDNRYRSALVLQPRVRLESCSTYRGLPFMQRIEVADDPQTHCE
jgi:hypothetical protein